jgi:hypothetical protein
MRRFLPDPTLGAVYAAEVLPQVPRLLSLLDRETSSASFGSFDREHWSWKFRDFPIVMMQGCLCPLALLWAGPYPGSPYHRNGELLSWIEGAIEETCRRRHRNGAFDSVAPNTMDHAVTLVMVYYLTETLEALGEALAAETRDRVAAALRRACEFALGTREEHAFISNHQALFAMAWRNAAELFGDDRYRSRASETVAGIIERQSPDGFYHEYEGADPGYESLGIFYLAQYWQRTGSAETLESLRRAVEFHAYAVHPDASVGGVYGSRHTSLYFPAGFEILAGAVPMAGSVAEFLRERLDRRNVVTPAAADPHNLMVLAHNYLEAALASPRGVPAPLLPCESLRGERHFPDAGLSVAGTDRYYAVIGARKGGVCRIFDRRRRVIAYEDAGYLVRAGGRLYTSQLLGASAGIEAGGGQVSTQATFAEVRHELPTPARYLVLRLLNLTLFRSRAMGIWLVRLVIGRLILSKRFGPLRLRRTVTFSHDGVGFHDRIETTSRIRVEAVDLPRRFTAIHMGSARYYHPAELEVTPRVSTKGAAEALNARGSAEVVFSLRFAGDGPVELAAAAAAVPEVPWQAAR